MFQEFTCPGCSSERFTKKKNYYTCTSCKEQFPIVDTIPVLVKDQVDFLTSTFRNLYEYIRSQTNLLNDYKIWTNGKSSKTHHHEDLENAVISNNNHLGKIATIVKPYIDPVKLVLNNSTSGNDYKMLYKDFLYLKRDWSGYDDGEEQIKAIKDIFFGNNHNSFTINKGVALFVGSGTGRIAYELAPLHDYTLISDKSYSMAWHFSKIKDAGINFHEYHFKNLKQDKSRISSVNIENRQLNFNGEYIVCDAVNLPCKTASINYYYSVYFTDVVALKLLLPEVKRVLAEDGLFIHFGPLDYFFDDTSEMLSPEEIKLYLEQEGFTILFETFIETPHLKHSGLLSYKVYNNWFLVAQKNKIKLPDLDKLTDASVLSLKKPITFDIKGVLKQDEIVLEYFLKLSENEVFEGAELVLETLKLIDGNKNLSELFKELGNDYKLTKKFRKELTETLEFLVTKELLLVDNVSTT